jgi:hypothetical protein
MLCSPHDLFRWGCVDEELASSSSSFFFFSFFNYYYMKNMLLVLIGEMPVFLDTGWSYQVLLPDNWIFYENRLFSSFFQLVYISILPSHHLSQKHSHSIQQILTKLSLRNHLIECIKLGHDWLGFTHLSSRLIMLRGSLRL